MALVSKSAEKVERARLVHGDMVYQYTCAVDDHRNCPVVVVSLMYVSFVLSVGQQDKDFGHLPLAFTGICITLAGLFFGAGQKLFHDLRNAGNEHIKIAVLYALAGILVATFTFIYPSYANLVTPYAVYSIPLWVVSSSLAAGVIAFVVATCLTVILFFRHLK